MSKLRIARIVIALLAPLLPAVAHAFTIEAGVIPGCHEKLTLEGFRAARSALPDDATAPLPSSGDDEPLMADVPFSVPKSLRNMGPVTLLLGVRDNDVKEHGPLDLKDLTPEASQAGKQAEHCLREKEQDGTEGSRQAVEACRKFIRNALLGALDGLDANGHVDPRKRETLKVSLAIRDEVEVDVPLFYLRAGRGLHALQDSFSHTFRNPENPGKIRVVLNFADYTQGTLNEAVDGPAHASELDVCDNPDELRTERRALAAEASGVALMALLDPSLSREAKEQAVENLLNDYVSYDDSAECALENDWCDAAERGYGSPPLGCQFALGTSRTGGAGLALLVGAVMARRRRRAILLAPLLSCVVSGQARADETKEPGDRPAVTSPGAKNASPPVGVDKVGAFFGRVAAGASYDNAAMSAGLGLRYQLTDNWMLGLDGEWNPYIATATTGVRTGSANAYFSLIRRFQLRYAPANIRSWLSAGGSMLLFDLVGANKFSKGPFFGISFLGVEWKMSRGVYLTIDPTYIAIPIPNTVGLPFMYAQYRFLVGLEFGG